MKRREFITLLGGSLAFARPARAQASLPVIGFLNGGTMKGYAPFVEAWRLGLRQAGFVDGQNVTVQYRWTDGDPTRVRGYIEELVRLPSSVIVVSGGDAPVREAKAIITGVPVVATFGSDPVENGTVSNINRPGANITGVSVFAVQLVEKRLELARLLASDARVAYLINPGNPHWKIDLAQMEGASARLKQDYVVLRASTDAECDELFVTLPKANAKVLIVESDPFFIGNIERLVRLAAENKIAAVFPRREYAAAGGLLSYGSNLSEAYRQLGIYTGRVLKGDKPADLPIVLPTRFEMVVNLKTANVLGITMPTDILLRADEVME